MSSIDIVGDTRRTLDTVERRAMNGDDPDGMRRALLAQIGSAAALALAGGGAWAQAWPTRPIRVVLGYAPGGSADVTARELTAPLAAPLGQPLVVDYKSGASGIIAAAEVARAAPDGYTLGLMDNAPLTIVPTLRKVDYDPLAAFTPITLVTQIPQVLVVGPSAGVATLQELVNAMRKAPGRLSYASGGAGSVSHLTTELLKAHTSTFAVHVPYRGAGPAITALLTGEVQFGFFTPTATAPFIQSGKLKALGVGARARLAALPDVPTVAEAGLSGFEAQGWFALMGPAGLPEPIVATLRKAVADVLATPTVVARLVAGGQTIAPPRLDVRATIAAERAMWKKLISERKITIDG